MTEKMIEFKSEILINKSEVVIVEHDLAFASIACIVALDLIKQSFGHSLPIRSLEISPAADVNLLCFDFAETGI